jgi:hypothetical protein
MTSLLFEKTWPCAGALIITLLWCQFFDAHFPTELSGFLTVSGTVAAVFIGFLATAKAVILGLSQSEIFAVIKRTGYSSLLISYMFQTSIAAIALLVLSLCGFFLPTQPIPFWFSYCWMLTATASILLYLRIASVLYKLIERA